MPDGTPHLLPELARSLRMLGAEHDPCTRSAHDAVFGPLLDARARAGANSQDKALAAFKGSSLIVRIEGAATAAATLNVADPALARSRSAYAIDVLRELRAAAEQLDAHGETARTDERAWEAWLGALRTLFRTADHACESLAKILAEPIVDERKRNWFKRTNG